ncbi:MAG: aspartate-semialdehyde dehydrogenase [Planctomycetota bacterium]|jgi:aspartate-semialdehyde dehydrogenase
MKVAIVGASGVVGQEMRALLEERKFPVSELRLLASSTRGEYVEATAEALKGCDLALFSAGSGVARRLGPGAADDGALVVDNSSAFRMTHPLIIPELNGGRIGDARIIANPNCSTILLAMAVAPLREIKRVVVCSYQAVSGAGAEAMEELRRQEADESAEARVFPKKIAHNVIPWVQAIEDDGYSTEETKVQNELRRILDKPELPVTATCVRVPVLRAHSEAVHVELDAEVSPEEAADRLRSSDGVVVHDHELPTPRDVAGLDTVHIGRIRRDRAFKPGLALWCVMDQLRKGAALNAIQIAERALGVRA